LLYNFLPFMPENGNNADPPDFGDTPGSQEGTSLNGEDPQVARLLRLYELYPEMLEDDSVTSQTKSARAKLQELLTEAGPDPSPSALVDICTGAYRALPQPPENFTGNPSGMREYIEYLIGVDPKVAFGAVFDIASREYKKESRVSAAARASIMEQIHDLVALLDAMCCHGGNSAAGLTRLRTLLRYMLEPHYLQDTTTAELLYQWSKTKKREAEETGTPRIHLRQNTDWAFDLGCGNGATLDTLANMVGEERVRGYDISPSAAMKHENARIGLIDTPQEWIAGQQGGKLERLSFQHHFGKGGLVLDSLTMDRVADQGEKLLNALRLLRPGGYYALALLLPVRCEDDEPDLRCRLRYAVNPFTVGENADDDYRIIADRLTAIGFESVSCHRVPIHDPVTGRAYDNHFVILARKKKAEKPQGRDAAVHVPEADDEEDDTE